MEKQNCFFCYCPFYPCQDTTKGTWLSTPQEDIWDCSPCTWIHTDTVVKRIVELLYEGKNFAEVKQTLIEEGVW